MTKIYFDNAATTPIIPEVVEVMQQSMIDNFGNPSSVHSFGRKARTAIETARKNIASYFGAQANEIIFTSCGTEANNLILNNAIENLGVKKIITSKLEHHAVLHVIEFWQKKKDIEVQYIEVDSNGFVSLDDLEQKLSSKTSDTLVSLMMVNNEIGTLLPIKQVAELCKQYNAYFHSDTVQAIGDFKIELDEIPIDFMTASAHKFNGPKGIGFAFIRQGIKIGTFLHGGNQERGVRSGTENVHYILGMEKALTMTYENLNKRINHKIALKNHLINGLKKINPVIEFNGLPEVLEKSSPKIVNVRFPLDIPMLLFNLDIQGIAASGGSACQSGSATGSHVLQAFLSTDLQKKTSVRFSFGHLNTIEEVDVLLNKIETLFNQ